MTETLAGPLPSGGARPEIFSRVRLQTAFRLASALFILGITAAIQWRGGLSLARYDFLPLYVVTAIVFATSIPAAVALRRLVSSTTLEVIAYGLFLVDVGVITALVYLTGGADSPFSFLYLLTIINASAVLFRRGAVLTAAASAIAYGLLVNLSYYQVIEPFAPDFVGGGDVSSRDALYKIAGTSLGFLLTGVLGGYLAEVLRKTGQELEEKSIGLRELQALTKNIVENINSGLLTVDREGRITSFNRSAEEVTGQRLEQVYGLPLARVFPGVSERITRHMLESRRYEESFRHADGSLRTLGFSYSPLRNDDDQEIGTIVIFTDLTELREMETRLKREERLAAVGRLAAGIAHEIRNPLASISGSIEILRKGTARGGESSVSPDDARLMEIILRETDRLDGLITEFLQYVKPVKRRAGKVVLEELVHETADAVNATEAGRGIRFQLPDAVGMAVRGDRDQLKQVLWNLFLNAAQATAGKGTVSVSLQPSRMGSRGEVVLVEVSDDGVGIPQEEIARIFEPFFTTKERGTGLGLAMVHKIVEAHEGHIEVESRPGAGATFRLVLSCWTAEDEALSASEEPRADRETSGVFPAAGKHAGKHAGRA